MEKCFFLRIWLQWLLENGYTLQNFITSNAYTCIEINAHTIVAAVNLFRQKGLPELFVPWLYSSQPCEQFFRAARSLTSIDSTVLNFSMLEFIYRVQKIQFQAHVTHVMGKDYAFPRYERRLQRGKEIKDILSTNNLPTENEMFVNISRSREDAIKLATFLGMVLQNTDNILSSLVDFQLKDKKVAECYADDADDIPIDDEEVVSSQNEIQK